MNMRILVVEDEKPIAILLRICLGRKGHAVVLAEDGATAMALFNETLEENPFDLVITDISLPVLGGMEVSRQVKQASPLTAVILTSGYPASKEDCGADGYLQKPFETDHLWAEIGRVTGAGSLT
jgi:two-component system response regulator VicR